MQPNETIEPCSCPEPEHCEACAAELEVEALLLEQLIWHPYPTDGRADERIEGSAD